MTNEEHLQIITIVNAEIQKFKQDMLLQNKEEIYDNHYKICAYERLYSYIANEGSYLDYKGFPKENILDYFYDKFMDADYNLEEDMPLFLKEEIEQYKYHIQYIQHSQDIEM